jgi:RNA polymerase sigma factor (sigma-70 family)
MEAARDFHQFHGTSHKDLLRWLGRILRNNVRNIVRDFRGRDKRQVSREVALGDPTAQVNLHEALVAATPGPEADAMHREEVSSLQRALVKLPDVYRQVVFLRDYQSLKFEEICRRMHLPSADAARKLHERAVDHLRPMVCAPSQLYLWGMTLTEAIGWQGSW